MADPTIIFTVGSESIEIPGPEYNEHPGEGLAQSIQVAMGGRVTSITQATTIQYDPILTWSTLPDADFQILMDFIETVAVGAENTMTYTDYRGTVWDAVYMGGLEEAEQDDYDCWSLKLKLKLYTI